MKQSFADILRKIDSKATKKLSGKLPEWANAEIQIPSTLALEQCSSSDTAFYKAELAAAEGPHERIADITGGLGADSWAFSRIASKVLHNEIDTKLSRAVSANFEKLGITNVEFSNEDAASPAFIKTLEEFKPDVIFADPARRNAEGKKVFLIEECTPNILELLPDLIRISPTVILKLSPMADIKMVATRIGGYLKAVHIVSFKGECKELLCVISRSNRKEYSITATDTRDSLTFTPREEADATASFETSIEHSPYLFEPGPALLKSGAFKLICKRFNLKKIGRDAHLYTTPHADTPLGKTYTIIESVPLSSETIKSIGKKYPAAEVTSRALKMTSDDLRHKLKVKPGQGIHIFGVEALQDRLLIVTQEPLFPEF